MFETTTTFMTNADNKSEKNGVIHKKELPEVIQDLVYLSKISSFTLIMFNELHHKCNVNGS